MLGLERPTVIGHSLGAEVAGQLAAAYPDCVRAVVLVDPPLYPFPPSDHAEGEIPPGLDELVQAVAALQTQTHAQRLLTMLDIMPPDVTLSLWDEADYSSRVEAVAQFDPNVFRYHLGTSFIESPETIERIAYPLLLMSSRVVVPDEAAAPGVGVFETNWRNGRHVHVPDSGHYIPNERFGRFVEVVRRFLSE
jgi:pimeloyl-ACP methyl ester carboxylesterase